MPYPATSQSRWRFVTADVKPLRKSKYAHVEVTIKSTSFEVEEICFHVPLSTLSAVDIRNHDGLRQALPPQPSHASRHWRYPASPSIAEGPRAMDRHGTGRERHRNFSLKQAVLQSAEVTDDQCLLPLNPIPRRTPDLDALWHNTLQQNVRMQRPLPTRRQLQHHCLQSSPKLHDPPDPSPQSLRNQKPRDKPRWSGQLRHAFPPRARRGPRHSRWTRLPYPVLRPEGNQHIHPASNLLRI